ncbi:GntR family transcriptional regulator [Robbsia sp. Bb-Pol-6]|uniref:GntR family transcriptional regulator n=1 Tax=Robbsia betulipollinis TaxID=2981849 RepID=A0ABT3ZLT8_9BURK|nr:GntR family transcriptional regulator [Robbsia betulipollinis]MCY0387302.1 GntR family transcriptional regulator [Robbsia betulipollinis]
MLSDGRRASRVSSRVSSRAETAYARLRDDIFTFRMLPGDRFTESDVAACLGISRTPVREALLRLQGEGLVRVQFRSGWEVVPLDFGRFEDLYELRKLIERHAIRTLCVETHARVDRAVLTDLRAQWCGPADAAPLDSVAAAARDEAFHIALVRAAGNAEILDTFAHLTDKIRVIRRLDFEYDSRVRVIRGEHAALLDAILARDAAAALELIGAHIDAAHAEVSKITVQRIQQARADALRGQPDAIRMRHAL